MTVRCRDQGPVGKDLHRRVGAVPAVVVVHEPDPVLTLPALDDVLIGADPADPVALGSALVRRVAKGDEEPAELAIFSFGASDLSANVRRWISQFQADGREVKVTTGESTQGKYVFVNIKGTYNKSVGPPIQGKSVAVPGSRVLAVILVVPEKGVYYLKMVGLDKTVAAQGDALRASFGASKDKEKELDID